jgi:hypothetical protein
MIVGDQYGDHPPRVPLLSPFLKSPEAAEDSGAGPAALTVEVGTG